MKKQLENLREALAKPEEIKLDDVEVSVRLEYIDDIKSSFEEAQVVIEQHLDSSIVNVMCNRHIAELKHFDKCFIKTIIYKIYNIYKRHSKNILVQNTLYLSLRKGITKPKTKTIYI